jgi:methionyl-tRNA formyltransferase
MRVVFCGTPQFAVPTLKHLLGQKDFSVIGVVTQPDRPRGRGQQVSRSPVKETAMAAGIAVHQPEKIGSPEAQELLQSLAPDFVVIIAYGQIIPARLLPVPEHGWINLHASLLPQYRGAAPINWAIANGEGVTGLTTMRIDAGMDTGEIVLQEELTIGAAETAPELMARMSEAGAPLMLKTLRGLASDSLTTRPQIHAEATYAPILKREDGRIDWNRSAQEIYNRIRGFDPWPGAFTNFRGQACHIWGQPVSNPSDDLTRFWAEHPSPGTLHQAGNDLFVACGDATLLLLTGVKREGRKQISAAEFANGVRLTTGERFSDI